MLSTPSRAAFTSCTQQIRRCQNVSSLRRRGTQQCLFQSSSKPSSRAHDAPIMAEISKVSSAPVKKMKNARCLDELQRAKPSIASHRIGLASANITNAQYTRRLLTNNSIKEVRIKSVHAVSAIANELCRQSHSSQHNNYRPKNDLLMNPNFHCRYFSSTPDENEHETKNSKRDRGDDHNEIVDKEFAEYLTGKMDEGASSIDQPPGLSKTNQKVTTSNDEQTNCSDENVSEKETGDKTQSTGDWFNSLVSNQTDLGRPNTEVNEAYRNIERKNVRNIQKLREKQIKTVRRALGGNVVIAGSKLFAFMHSGSSAMLSEFIHSVVDCGNQSLLLVGLRDSGNEADRAHPYGYGKSIYFWALVSALGTFFLGAGVSMTQAVPQLIYGGNLHEVTSSVWGVLVFSFVVDGYVLTKTLMEVKESAPEGTTLFKRIQKLRDPATLAILLEDGAACLGVVMAISGIAATQAFGMPVYDALAGVGISGLLAAMGIILVRVNHKFLLGQAVDKETRVGIEKILLNRRSIDNVNSVQSQWTGPDTFSYKAEVDFDGTFLAAKLMPRYQQEFTEAKATLDQDLRVLLSWYAEDVMRTVEREVRNVEAEIRREYPGAQYIELEPMSKDYDRFAIDDGLEASLKRIEIEALNRCLKSLYQPAEKSSSLPSKSKDPKDESDK